MIRKELQKFPGAKGKYFINFLVLRIFWTLYRSCTFRKFAIDSVANSMMKIIFGRGVGLQNSRPLLLYEASLNLA